MKEVQQVASEQQCAWDIQVSFLYALNIGNMLFHLHKIQAFPAEKYYRYCENLAG